MDFSPSAKSECEQKISSVKEMLSQLKDDADTLSASLSQFDLQYSSPTPNFDRKKVMGMVAKLVRIKDPKVLLSVSIVWFARVGCWMTALFFSLSFFVRFVTYIVNVFSLYLFKSIFRLEKNKILTYTLY